MLANARQPSQGPNSRAAAAPTATTSSHGLVSVSASLPGGDHLLENDVALDRGREHVAPGIGGEPALPLEHVEGLSDGGVVESGGTRQSPRVYAPAQRGRRAEHPLRDGRQIAEP